MTPGGCLVLSPGRLTPRSCGGWHDLIDLDAGAIASGQATIEEIGWALFRLLLQIASGERETCAERLKLANHLVIFNPATIT